MALQQLQGDILVGGSNDMYQQVRRCSVEVRPIMGGDKTRLRFTYTLGNLDLHDLP